MLEVLLLDKGSVESGFFADVLGFVAKTGLVVYDVAVLFYPKS